MYSFVIHNLHIDWGWREVEEGNGVICIMTEGDVTLGSEQIDILSYFPLQNFKKLSGWIAELM